MKSNSINSYHCEVCQKATRHFKVPFDDVMREIGDPGALSKMTHKMKSLFGSLSSRTKPETYKCIGCRSFLMPHLGTEHRYAIAHEFQPWHVVQRSPEMLREVREKYNPNL